MNRSMIGWMKCFVANRYRDQNMDGEVEGQMEEWMIRQKDGSRVGWGWKYEWIDGSFDG